MKSPFKPLLLSVLLASAGMVSTAHAAGPDGQLHAGAMARHGGQNLAQMQQRMAQHQAELQAKLKLSAGQEAAWARFVAAMQPPADLATRLSRENRAKLREEMQALTTPERIDRMNAMKAQRDARMAQRGDATKAFYAELSPEQQKVFDDSTLRGRRGWHRHADHGRNARTG